MGGGAIGGRGADEAGRARGGGLARPLLPRRHAAAGVGRIGRRGPPPEPHGRRGPRRPSRLSHRPRFPPACPPPPPPRSLSGLAGPPRAPHERAGRLRAADGGRAAGGAASRARAELRGHAPRGAGRGRRCRAEGGGGQASGSNSRRGLGRARDAVRQRAVAAAGGARAEAGALDTGTARGGGAGGAGAAGVRGRPGHVAPRVPCGAGARRSLGGGRCGRGAERVVGPELRLAGRRAVMPRQGRARARAGSRLAAMNVLHSGLGRADRGRGTPRSPGAPGRAGWVPGGALALASAAFRGRWPISGRRARACGA